MAYLDNRGIVDTNNATTTPLNAGLTWTGTATDVSQYESIVVAYKTDQIGQCKVQFSTDGTNWDSTLTFDYNPSLIEPPHRLTITRKYVRVVFENTSASNQTFLRLQTLLGGQADLNSPLNAVVAQNSGALIVKNFDFNISVASGLYQNYSTIVKDGINPDIDTGSTPEDIWGGGSLYTGFPAASDTLTVVSTSAGDTGTVYFSYLESSSSTDYSFGSIVLTGTTPVTTAFQVYRLNYAYYDNGSTFNIGEISFYQTATPANIFALILAGQGQTFCAAFTVPASATAYIDRVTAIIKGQQTTASVDGFFYYKRLGASPILRQAFTVNFGAIYFDDVDYLFAYPQTTDVIPRIISASSNNLTVQVSYRLVLVKNQIP